MMNGSTNPYKPDSQLSNLNSLFDPGCCRFPADEEVGKVNSRVVVSDGEKQHVMCCSSMEWYSVDNCGIATMPLRMDLTGSKHKPTHSLLLSTLKVWITFQTMSLLFKVAVIFSARSFGTYVSVLPYWQSLFCSMANATIFEMGLLQQILNSITG